MLHAAAGPTRTRTITEPTGMTDGLRNAAAARDCGTETSAAGEVSAVFYPWITSVCPWDD